MPTDKNDKDRFTQLDLLKEFYKKNPNRDISHPEVVDWATSEWTKRTGKVFRDPDRGIRQLHESGYLIKVEDGVYQYNPDEVKHISLENFSATQKAKILERDTYKCVICGRGKKDGVELHVDHIKPRSMGGRANIENGQTLCSQHNFIKKNLKQTETGKKMFIRLYDLAKKEDNKSLQEFCARILQTYEDFKMNGHIVWQK